MPMPAPQLKCHRTPPRTLISTPKEADLQFTAIVIGNMLEEQLSSPTSGWSLHYVYNHRLVKEVVGNDMCQTQTIGGTIDADPIPRLYLAYVGLVLAGGDLIL